MRDWGAEEGRPVPLGATWLTQGQACNFALYSEHATGVTLLLYTEKDTAQPVFQYPLDYLKNKTGHVWHCRIAYALMKEARYYGYRVDGPYAPEAGHRFDADKILLDPYAKAVFFPEQFSREAASRPGSNAGAAALGVILPATSVFDWGSDTHPRHTGDTVIYEMHVRGFSQRANSHVSPESRGTYAGVIAKIPYLKELGVTAVELLPVHQYDPGEGNYWGYMTLNFFAPHHAYAVAREPGAQVDEFRAMVKALHAADIEVILDVVYSHTTEIDERGPTYSFRGIDNKNYYLLTNEYQYRNDAGTGNVLDCASPVVRRMIIDSIMYWIREMHVDGFRFDLATIFTRDVNGRINLDDPPIITEISGLEDLSLFRLIAEAWDPATYQLGRKFPGTTWLQWNGRFRDDVRAFVRGDDGMMPAFMARLYGSDDLFPDRLDMTYHPYQSINYVASHDGFCLYDLTAYNNKHNDRNGWHNADGMNKNVSWNCGWEGDIGAPPEIWELRKRQIKNYCCILFLANGTPMLCAGDEFLGSHIGNNNPYNQDNETNWLDWSLAEKNRDMVRFFTKMVEFRKTHPSLGRSRFWRDDVTWYGVGRDVDYSYHSHSLAFCLRGKSQADDDIYVMINAWTQDLVFTIQEIGPYPWRRAVDTALPYPLDVSETGHEPLLSSEDYRVKSRSIAVFVRKSKNV
ncbi:MAG: glycogen debranching protein [Acidiferrobacter sp.]